VKSSDLKRFSDREKVLQGLEHGNYDLFKGAPGFWEKAIKEKVVHMGADIDQSVTLDLARLIRVPSTIHGGSSLLSDYVKDISSFDPFRDMVVFRNCPVKIRTTEEIAPLMLNGQAFGPYGKDTEIQVPEYLAMFLFCRGKATFAG
jgi:DNA primase small subunit